MAAGLSHGRLHFLTGLIRQDARPAKGRGAGDKRSIQIVRKMAVTMSFVGGVARSVSRLPGERNRDDHSPGASNLANDGSDICTHV